MHLFISHLKDCSDSRNNGWCIHCHKPLHKETTTRDHVPLKALLKTPLPSNLPVINICLACNNKYSADEEYLMAFIVVVLTGSTDPGKINDPKIKNVLLKNSPLRERLEKCRIEKITPGCKTEIFWNSELTLIHSVLLKNVKGQVIYEFGTTMLDEPVIINIRPIVSMSLEERESFEKEQDELTFWPEVGSRMMSRIFEDMMEHRWIIVQSLNIQVFSNSRRRNSRVKSFIHEYLAVEIYWE